MRIAKMAFTRMVGPAGRKKLQVKVDIPAKVRHLFDDKSALTRFPQPGEIVAEIIGGFQRRIEQARAPRSG